MQRAVQCDEKQDYAAAYYAYCEGLQSFVPLIASETDTEKKLFLQQVATNYMERAEEIKRSYIAAFAHSNDTNNTNTTSSAAVQSDASSSTADNPVKVALKPTSNFNQICTHLKLAPALPHATHWTILPFSFERFAVRVNATCSTRAGNRTTGWIVFVWAEPCGRSWSIYVRAECDLATAATGTGRHPKRSLAKTSHGMDAGGWVVQNFSDDTQSHRHQIRPSTLFHSVGQLQQFTLTYVSPSALSFWMYCCLLVKCTVKKKHEIKRHTVSDNWHIVLLLTNVVLFACIV